MRGHADADRRRGRPRDPSPPRAAPRGSTSVSGPATAAASRSARSSNRATSRAPRRRRRRARAGSARAAAPWPRTAGPSRRDRPAASPMPYTVSVGKTISAPRRAAATASATGLMRGSRPLRRAATHDAVAPGEVAAHRRPRRSPRRRRERRSRRRLISPISTTTDPPGAARRTPARRAARRSRAPPNDRSSGSARTSAAARRASSRGTYGGLHDDEVERPPLLDRLEEIALEDRRRRSPSAAAFSRARATASGERSVASTARPAVPARSRARSRRCPCRRRRPSALDALERVERDVDEHLRLGPWHEDPGTHPEREAPERLLPGEVLERVPVAPRQSARP